MPKPTRSMATDDQMAPNPGGSGARPPARARLTGDSTRRSGQGRQVGRPGGRAGRDEPPLGPPRGYKGGKAGDRDDGDESCSEETLWLDADTDPRPAPMTRFWPSGRHRVTRRPSTSSIAVTRPRRGGWPTPSPATPTTPPAPRPRPARGSSLHLRRGTWGPA